jgi:hypothetical protein
VYELGARSNSASAGRVFLLFLFLANNLLIKYDNLSSVGEALVSKQSEDEHSEERTLLPSEIPTASSPTKSSVTCVEDGTSVEPMPDGVQKIHLVKQSADVGAEGKQLEFFVADEHAGGSHGRPQEENTDCDKNVIPSVCCIRELSQTETANSPDKGEPMSEMSGD